MNTRNTHEITLLFAIFWSVTESIVASLHFQFSNLFFSYWFFLLLGEKSLRIISEFFFCLTGEYQKLDINYGIISEKKLKNGRTEKIGKTILETPRQANNWNKKNAEK